MNNATAALHRQALVTTMKMRDVFAVVSSKRPINGSANPANRYEEKFMIPVAVPARLAPTRSGHSAQKLEAGP